MMVEHLISSTVLPLAIEEHFTNYKAIPEAFETLDVSGLEFTFLPEWDPEHPPLGRTAADWENCPKPTMDELVDTLEGIYTPVVHINRDVGDMLCSDEMLRRGENILEKNLSTAERMGAEVAVIHLWDTRAESLDLEELWKSVSAMADRHRKISIAVENVPISAEMDVESAWDELSRMMEDRHGFTLDLNWCSFYDNFDELKRFKDEILNVHLQGYVSRDGREVTMEPKNGDLDILKKLSEFCEDGYDDYITLEMNKVRGMKDFRDAIELMKDNS